MNSFGRIFRVSIFGESHGHCVGVCIDGCPDGVPLCEADFAADLDRRRSGAHGTTPRKENDAPQIVSGVCAGITTGAPLTIVFNNADTQSQHYEEFRTHPRPSHADFAAGVKYRGHNDIRGGGHFSGRLTLALVAAGAVAKKIIPSVKISACLTQIGGQPCGRHGGVLEAAAADGDSLGGIVECRAKGAPAGWGSPFFDSMESLISHLAFAIPGARGIEFGTGFAAAQMTGSSHNDAIINSAGATQTNHAGGVTGGITNGNELVFRIAFKPTASIARAQNTYDFAAGKITPLAVKGRHDVCFALRTPVIVEAVCAIAMADCAMTEKNHTFAPDLYPTLLPIS